MAHASWFNRRADVITVTSIKRALPILIGIPLIFAGACKVGPNYRTPPSSVAGQWQENAAVTNRAYTAADAFWWRYFSDTNLDQLIAVACRQNLSLQIAGVRVLEARARLNQSIGNLFPQQQGLSGQATYSRLNDSSTAKTAGLNSDYLSDQVLFSATWEIDFWGKYRRGIEADRASYLGTVAAYDDAMVTLIADVASTYVNIRTLEERLEVAERNLETQRESLRIATARFAAGETAELDMQQAATQLAQTEAQLPLLKETISQNENALAVLLGERPDEMDRQLTGPARIPMTPTNVAAGIPRDLLRRRPDVRVAGLQAASASALIGVARANLYPAFSLSGEFGYSGNNQLNNSLSDTFNWQNRVVNAGAGVVLPVFNYGRLMNQVRVQDAQFQQAILQYQNTVLAAQQEVENGLAAFAHEQNALAALTRAASSARRSTDLAMIQYKGGQTDYTTVLSAEQAELSVENNVAATKGNVALGLIAVYRALGGGWEIRGSHDVVSDEVKAEMKRRTDWGWMLEPSHHLPRTSPVAGVTETNAVP